MARKNSSTLGIKILALLCAIILWVYVYYQEGAEGTKLFSGIPVIAQNIPQEMILMGNLPTSTITLRGSERALENITNENVSAFVNLSEKEAGFHQLEIETNFPSTVRLDKIVPKNVSLDLQKFTTITLDIKHEFIGEAQVGLNISEPQIEPEKIKIQGPYSIVSTLKQATVVLDLTKAKPGENVEQLPFKLITNTNDEIRSVRWKANNLSPEFQKVSVVYNGDLKISTKLIPTFASTSGNIPSDYIITSLDWEPKVISLKGDHNTLKEISILNSNPLNLNGITVSNTYTLALKAPKGTEFVSNKSITVKLKVEKLVTKTLSNIDIKVTPDNVLYKLDKRVIDLLIKGPSSAINKALGADVSIDISNLEKGVHFIPVKITGLPSGVYSVTTPSVRIEIE